MIKIKNNTHLSVITLLFFVLTAASCKHSDQFNINCVELGVLNRYIQNSILESTEINSAEESQNKQLLSTLTPFDYSIEYKIDFNLKNKSTKEKYTVEQYLFIPKKIAQNTNAAEKIAVFKISQALYNQEIKKAYEEYKKNRVFVSQATIAYFLSDESEILSSYFVGYTAFIHNENDLYFIILPEAADDLNQIQSTFFDKFNT